MKVPARTAAVRRWGPRLSTQPTTDPLSSFLAAAAAATAPHTFSHGSSHYSTFLRTASRPDNVAAHPCRLPCRRFLHNTRYLTQQNVQTPEEHEEQPLSITSLFVDNDNDLANNSEIPQEEQQLSVASLLEDIDNDPEDTSAMPANLDQAAVFRQALEERDFVYMWLVARRVEFREYLLDLPGEESRRLVRKVREAAGASDSGVEGGDAPTRRDDNAAVGGDQSTVDPTKALDQLRELIFRRRFKAARTLAEKPHFHKCLAKAAPSDVEPLLAMARAETSKADSVERTSLSHIRVAIRGYIVPDVPVDDPSPLSGEQVDAFLHALKVLGGPAANGHLNHVRLTDFFEALLLEGDTPLALRITSNRWIPAKLARMDSRKLEFILRIVKEMKPWSAERTAALQRIRQLLFNAYIKSLFIPPTPPSSSQSSQSQSATRPRKTKKATTGLVRVMELLTGHAERDFGVSPSAEDFHVAIAHSDNIDTVKTLVSLATNSSIQLSSITWGKVAVACAGSGDWAGVSWAWEETQAFRAAKMNLAPLSGHHRARGPAEDFAAKEWLAFVRMHLQKLSPTEIAPLLVDYPTWEAIDSALQSNPNQCRYLLKNTLRHFIKLSLPDQALDVYHLMRSQPSTSPDHKDYRFLIKGFCRHKELHIGLGIARHMEAAGFDKDVDVDQVSKMIMHYVKNDRRGEAEALYREWVDLGRRPNAPAYSALISAALRKGNWVAAWKYYGELKEVDGADQVMERVWKMILTELSKRPEGFKGPVHHLKQLEDFWESEVVGRGGVPPLELYNIVISAFGRMGDVAGVARWMDKLKADGLKPDAFTLHAGVDSHIKSGDISKAREVYAASTTGNDRITPLRATVNVLIANMPDSASARELMEEAKTRHGIKPDEGTLVSLGRARLLAGEGDSAFDTLLAANAKSKSESGSGSGSFGARYRAHVNARIAEQQDLGRAMDLLKTPNFEPDTITYTTLISNLLKRNNVADAESVFQKMKESELTKPNDVTFLTLITYAAKRGDVKSLKRYMSEMSILGINPTVRIYSSLITGFSRVGDITSAENLYSAMKTQGIKPDTVIMNSLMTARANAGDVVGVMRWWQTFRKQGIPPTVVTYHIAIGAHARGSNQIPPAEAAQTAVQLLREMERNPNPSLRPSSHHPYTSVIAAHGRAGDLKSALERYGDMLDRSIPHTHETHNAIIGAHCSVGDVSGAVAWFEKAFGGRGFTPDAMTFSPILGAYAQRGDERSVWEWVRVMKGSGVAATAAVHSVVLPMLIKKGSVEDARKYLDENMWSLRGGQRRVVADAGTVVNVVTSFMERGDIGLAREWFDLFRNGGVAPGVRGWTALLKAYAQNLDVASARAVYADMLADGCQPNEITYLVLLDLAAKTRDGGEAKRVFDEMVGKRVRPQEQHVVALMDARSRSGDMGGVRECWAWILNRSWPGLPTGRRDGAEASGSTVTSIWPAAACVYLDSLGYMGKLKEVESTWSWLHSLPNHHVNANQRASYVEAL
ncbi:hypothetical protein HK104_002297, partial [Borealophlyctis nickersoniae]